MSRVRRLDVDTPQGQAGMLVKESMFSFGYGTSDPARAVSLALPVRHATYDAMTLHPVFEMNRPEGYLLDRIRRRFAKLGGLDDMALLKFTGRAQIGRLVLTDPVDDRAMARPKLGLKDVLESRSTELFEWLVETYLESGVSGFQPKVLANALMDDAPATGRRTDRTADLIVKAGGEDYPDLAQNEFLCMDAARRAGIRCPDFWLSDDGGLFAMRRFDVLDDGTRLGFEDACVLTLRPAARKYESSHETLAKMIVQYCGNDVDESLGRYFEYVALSVMARNGDAHLKNFGLLYDHPAGGPPALSPLYDVVTTSIYEMGRHPVTGMAKFDRTLALKLDKSREYPDRRRLCAFGERHCRVREPEQVIERIAAGMEASLKANKDRVSPWLFEAMKREWDLSL